MKHSLQLKTSQNLALTPQLQQSLQFLQLSAIELEQTLNALITENPFLTLAENEQMSQILSSQPADDNLKTESDEQSSAWDDIQNEPMLHESIQVNTLIDELPIDSQWDDYYPDDPIFSDSDPMHTIGTEALEAFDDLNQTRAGAISLKDHLQEQASVTRFSLQEQLIAQFIIEALDEDGYLTQSKEEILDALKELDPSYDYDSDFHSVLTRIQLFDPISIATYSLQERLLIQLSQLPASTEVILAKSLLENASHLLEKRDFKAITKQLSISQDALQAALGQLARLDPYPARSYQSDTTSIIPPDVVVVKKQNNWQVQLNNSLLPKIVLDSEYVKMLQRTKENKIKNDPVQKNAIDYLQDAYQSAKTVLYSLEGRYKTLLLVANQIVVHQLAFFEYGEAFLKPMTLAHLAETLEVSESTISRTCQNKHLVCERGVFELKYFFASHATTVQGEDISSQTIKTHLKQWIEEESKTKPLSDSKLEAKLKILGFDVARRTVAKYREQLGFSPSHLRKTL